MYAMLRAALPCDLQHLVTLAHLKVSLIFFARDCLNNKFFSLLQRVSLKADDKCHNMYTLVQRLKRNIEAIAPGQKVDDTAVASVSPRSSSAKSSPAGTPTKRPPASQECTTPEKQVRRSLQLDSPVKKVAQKLAAVSLAGLATAAADVVNNVGAD